MHHKERDIEQLVNPDVNLFSQSSKALEKMTEERKESDTLSQQDIKSLKLLQHLAEGTAAVTGSDFFCSLVHHLASALNVSYAFITQCTDEASTRVRTRAVWMGKEFGENFEYTLAGTPCENVINGTVCYYPNSLQTLFPSDVGLKEWGTESFLGIPIRDSYQNVLGHIAIFDREPMAEKPHGLSVLKIFAARAGAEMEREKAVHSLRESEERFRALFESAPIGVSINDAVGRFRHINNSFQEMLGYTEEELKGMSFKEITFAEDLDESKRLFTELVEGKIGDFRVEKRYVRKDGRLIWANTICSSIRDDGGNFMYTFAMVEDITERKNAEQALHEALLEVEQLKNRLEIENVYLQEEIKTEYNFEEIIGQSESLKKTLSSVEKVATSDSAVLIYGETGTGKELIARAIHNLSNRKDRPLVKVNCGAISAGLVESELFGHEKGAFTGALQQRVGRFELADGGTIFLDEVSELPLDTQVKLLRVLQEGEFERVGSSKTISADVRVIAATNRNLTDAVRKGSFRSDLFYRLNVFPIEVPPLRERRPDIPLLTNFFLTKFAKKMNKNFKPISKDTMDRITSYPWPGNIRELQNVIERAVVLSHGSDIQIDESLLGSNVSSELTIDQTLEDVERSHIIDTLEKTDWVIDGKRGAASILKINPSTLRSRMQKLGIRKLTSGQ
ncbi:MAG: sigma 54-interacting transcriptional regulator [Thermodesulfobacteriota bacterium]